MKTIVYRRTVIVLSVFLFLNQHDRGAEPNLDKSGISGWAGVNVDSQTFGKQALAKRSSFQTERGGFEPPIRLHVYRFSRPAWRGT